MRRLPTIVMAIVVTVCASAFVTDVAGAQPAPSSGALRHDVTSQPVVQVVKISGLIDPILADFLEQSIRAAERDGSIGVVLQVNSQGSIVSDDRLAELARLLHDTTVPVVAWVGPSGAVAEGGAAQLLAVVPTVGVAPGSKIGAMGRAVVPDELWNEPFRAATRSLRHDTVGAEQAKTLGLAPTPMLVLRQALLEVPGFQVKASTGADGVKVPPTDIRFSQLTTGASWMHTVASPAVAYLLFVIGLALILFELFTAGVGVAGLTGAGFVVLGSYGLWVLPVRWWAVAVLLAAMVAYVVDIQIGVPRAWTVIASVLFTLGTLTLYQDVATPWLALIGGIVGMVIFMVYGMPAMTRTRFSTPSIPRDQLVGEVGVTRGVHDPSGVVEIDDARWPSRTVDDVTLPEGVTVHVVEVDGVVLRVAPPS